MPRRGPVGPSGGGTGATGATGPTGPTGPTGAAGGGGARFVTVCGGADATGGSVDSSAAGVLANDVIVAAVWVSQTSVSTDVSAHFASPITVTDQVTQTGGDYTSGVPIVFLTIERP